MAEEEHIIHKFSLVIILCIALKNRPSLNSKEEKNHHPLSTIYNHSKYAGLFDGHLMGLIIKCFCLLGYKLLCAFL